MTRPAAALAAAVSVASLSACGGSGSTPDSTIELSPVAAVQRAAETSAAADSASFTLSVAPVDGSADSKKIDVRMHGSFRSAPDRAANFVLDNLSVIGMKTPATLEATLVDEVAYVRTGLIPGLDATKWIKFPFAAAAGMKDMAGGDTSALSGLLGKDAAGLDSMLSATQKPDPREVLDVLKTAVEVRKVGVENVDGDQATHYTAKVTPESVRKAIEASPELSAQFEDMSKIDESGFEALDLDVWVDDQYRARRLVATTAGDGADYVLNLTIRDYGKAVEITAPAAGDVVDFQTVMQKALTGLMSGMKMPEGLKMPEGMSLPEGFTMPEGLTMPEGTATPGADADMMSLLDSFKAS